MTRAELAREVAKEAERVERIRRGYEELRIADRAWYRVAARTGEPIAMAVSRRIYVRLSELRTRYSF